MCTGLEVIAPLIASAAGVAGQAITQSEQQKQAQQQAEARNEELRRTLLKNDSLAQQGRDTFAKRMSDADKGKVDAQQKNATKQREGELGKAVEATADMKGQEGASISGSAPDIVGSDLAARMKSVLGEGKEQAKSLSKLGGYGDSWLKQGFIDAQAGRDIGTTTNKAAGNSSILPYAQDFAEYKATSPISPLGSLVSGFGNMAGSYLGSQTSKALPRKTYTTPFIG